MIKKGLEILQPLNYNTHFILKMANIPCKCTTTSIINHICFVIDASGSMSSLTNSVIKVFEAQIQYLCTMSQQMSQDTRVTIYFFNSEVECCVSDRDVLRLPKLESKYKPSGPTSLIDGMMKALYDLEQIKDPYCDSASLLFCITDGMENASKTQATELSKKLASLPNNFTVCCLVPDQQGVFESKKLGFPSNNIQIWNTNAAGLQAAGDSIKNATEAFFNNRAAGIVGSNNLFKLDTSNLSTSTVQQNLQELAADSYQIYQVEVDGAIKAFVEEKTGAPYVKGTTNYMLNKKELIQSYKKIFIRERTTGKVYGGDNARNLLKLPLNQDIDVRPDANNMFDIFVESTSVNRKVVAGTSVLVIK